MLKRCFTHSFGRIYKKKDVGLNKNWFVFSLKNINDIDIFRCFRILQKREFSGKDIY